MNEIINWVILSSILLALSVILALTGINKKNVNVFITAVAVFILFAVCGTITAYQLIDKSVTNISKGYHARQ